MGIEKASLKLGKDIIAWTRMGSKSMLTAKPVKINTTGLKIKPTLKTDIIRLDTCNQRWINAARNTPDISPNSHVPMHGELCGKNSSIRNTINHIQSGIREYDKMNLQDILLFDEEFNKLPPLLNDCIVYRGRVKNPVSSHNADFDIVQNSKVGDIIVPDKGYSYAAVKQRITNSFYSDKGNSIMYTIRLPKGAKVSRTLHAGGEIVMPRGAEYRIISKETTPVGNFEVTMEYILPKTDNVIQAKNWCQQFNVLPYSKEEALEILKSFG